MKSDKCAVFDIRKLFSHPYADGGKFFCTYSLNVIICDHGFCDISNGLEDNLIPACQLYNKCGMKT